MEILKSYALSFVGLQYHYGGDDPIAGFDCSGFVQELLTSCGVLPFGIGKLNAQMIFDRLSLTGSQNAWALGSIAFYGDNPLQIHHIGFCLDSFRMIEAGGGNAETLSIEDAIVRNAFIKIRPIKYRKDFLTVIKPSYSSIGYI